MSEADKIGGQVVGGVHGMLGPMGAGDVFSEPQVIGDRMVITAAAIEKAGGFGYGGGGDSDGGGSGGGGGGHAQGRPVAVIEVGSSGVEVHPVFDFTRLGIAVIATLVAVLRPRRKG